MLVYYREQIVELFRFGKNVKPHNKYLDKETLRKHGVVVLLLLGLTCFKTMQ